tara:strand:+ start:6753 stop:7727 length:975 start_codon:yes stop_codon:yes gene_type:complete
MPDDLELEADEPVELTEKDLAVIDEVNQENEPEETIGGADDDSGTSPEVDEPQDVQDVEPDVEDPGYDENLVQWANHYGINPSDYANEDALRRHVESTGRYYQQAQQAYQQQQQQYAQENPAETQGERIARQFNVGLDDDYDEGLRDAINGLAAEMQQHYDGQLEVLAQALLDQQQFIGGQQQQQQSAEYKKELDSFNEAVGDLGNERLFGESSYEDLSEGSLEAQNRENLYDQVLVLASGYQTQGKAIPSMSDLVSQAYHAAFSGEIENQSRKSFNDRVRNQAQRRLGTGASTKKARVPTDDPVDNPVLKEAFEGFLKENGDM